MKDKKEILSYLNKKCLAYITVYNETKHPSLQTYKDVLLSKVELLAQIIKDIEDENTN